MVHAIMDFTKVFISMQTPARHPTVTCSKSVSSYLDDTPAPVVVWESKDTNTGDKLMKQMENILNLTRTPEETFTLNEGKNRKQAQVWEIEMLKSKEDSNLNIER
jgi:hypothetical protein